MKLTLQWRSFLALVALLAALLVTINVALTFVLPPYLRGRIERNLEREAYLARAGLAPDRLDAVYQLQRETGLRFTVIATNGQVLAESDKKPGELAGIESHLYRPEVQDALRVGVGHARRHSDTLGVDMAYVAVRAPVGVVRVALPLTEIAATTGHVRRTVAGASLLVGLCAVPLVYWLTRRLTQPISIMREVAGNVARGDFTGCAPTGLTGELGELAAALNDMSAQLAARLHELSAEKAGLAAILAGMDEGVLVVDTAGKIRLMNAALRRQFQLTDDALGKTPLEVLRLVELDQPGTRELTVFTPTERIFAVNAACLAAGMVIVFHDITRLKQLENLRQEFVANVSHELRTPLAIIKGYIETLLDEQPPDPATARQFLLTIQKHSRQLENLIEDLLNISALESQRAKLDLVPVNLRDLAGSVVEELAGQARAKNIMVTIEDLPVVQGDRERLHQVFVNLLDNALKYTQADGRVVIRAQNNAICVADNGPGIAAEHLPRIFERFYRVDKARSRELGGTGLGLSIVKHIIQAHGGRVWAESTLGNGSRFYFSLPAPR